MVEKFRGARDSTTTVATHIRDGQQPMLMLNNQGVGIEILVRQNSKLHDQPSDEEDEPALLETESVELMCYSSSPEDCIHEEWSVLQGPSPHSPGTTKKTINSPPNKNIRTSHRSIKFQDAEQKTGPSAVFRHKKGAFQVRFGRVTVYHHGRTVDDNPGCHELGTVPWTIDWECLAVYRFDLKKDPQGDRPPRRSPKSFRIEGDVRRAVLLQHWNVSSEELQKSIEAADEIRLERSVSRSSRPTEEVDDIEARLQAARRVRWAKCVELRKEKYARQKQEREQLEKQLKKQRWEWRKQILKGLLTMSDKKIFKKNMKRGDTFLIRDLVEENETADQSQCRPKWTDDEVPSTSTSICVLPLNPNGKGEKRPKSRVGGWTRKLTSCVFYPLRSCMRATSAVVTTKPKDDVVVVIPNLEPVQSNLSLC